MALKIVDQDSVERLYEEKQALANAQDTGLTIRVVEEISEINVGSVTGAALLLCPVGRPLPQPKTLEEVEHLFELLWQLHAKGWAHGDPRVPNVIVSEGKLLWIDLVRVMKASNGLKEMDANILTRSILHLRHDAALDPVLEQLIHNYANSSTSKNINQLAKAVYLTCLQWLRKMDAGKL